MTLICKVTREACHRADFDPGARKVSPAPTWTRGPTRAPNRSLVRAALFPATPGSRSGFPAVHHQVVHGPVSERLGLRQDAEPAVAGGLGHVARRLVPRGAADLDERGQRRLAREVADDPDGLCDQA